MCTYQTRTVPLRGSGKGAAGWFPVTEASVYFDHPVHAPDTHTLNVDFLRLGAQTVERVAVELDPGSARALADAILASLDEAPAGLASPA